MNSIRAVVHNNLRRNGSLIIYDEYAGSMVASEIYPLDAASVGDIILMVVLSFILLVIWVYNLKANKEVEQLAWYRDYR